MPEKCEVPGRGFAVGWRKEMIHYLCELPKGHDGPHKAFVGHSYEEKWT